MSEQERREMLLMQSHGQRGSFHPFRTQSNGGETPTGTFGIRVVIAVFLVSMFWAIQKNNVTIFHQDSSAIVNQITNQMDFSQLPDFPML